MIIRANQKEFDSTVSQGNLALNVLLNEFKHGTENGLKEYIMAFAWV